MVGSATCRHVRVVVVRDGSALMGATDQRAVGSDANRGPGLAVGSWKSAVAARVTRGRCHRGTPNGRMPLPHVTARGIFPKQGIRARLIAVADNQPKMLRVSGSAEQPEPVAAASRGGRTGLSRPGPGPGRAPRSHRRATTPTTDTATAERPVAATRSRSTAKRRTPARTARNVPLSPGRGSPGCSAHCPGAGSG